MAFVREIRCSPLAASGVQSKIPCVMLLRCCSVFRHRWKPPPFSTHRCFIAPVSRVVVLSLFIVLFMSPVVRLCVHRKSSLLIELKDNRLNGVMASAFQSIPLNTQIVVYGKLSLHVFISYEIVQSFVVLCSWRLTTLYWKTMYFPPPAFYI